MFICMHVYVSVYVSTQGHWTNGGHLAKGDIGQRGGGGGYTKNGNNKDKEERYIHTQTGRMYMLYILYIYKSISIYLSSKLAK